MSRRFYTPPTDQVAGAHDHERADRRKATCAPPSMARGRRPGPAPPAGSKCVGAIGDTALYVFDYTWAPPPPPPGPTQSYQVYERPVLQAQIDRDFTLDETAKMAEGAQAQLQQDVGVVEQTNATIRERNARISEALGRVAGVDLGEDREAWLKWWMKRKGYSYIPPENRPKKTVNVQVPLPYVPQKGPDALTQGASSAQPQYCMLYDHDKGQNPTWNKCFAAGTRDRDPRWPTRDPNLAGRRSRREWPRFARPAHASRSSRYTSPAQSRTLRLVIAGEAIVTTDGHPFLMPGSGWTRAGDLEPGDLVQSFQGPARVEAC